VDDRDLQSTVYPSGQLLLSKLPFQASVYAFSNYKRLVCGEFVINERLLCVPVVHLSRCLVLRPHNQPPPHTHRVH
jgi:hypothetical protein